MSTKDRQLKSGNDNGAAIAAASQTNQRSGADNLINILSKRSVVIGIALAVLVASAASKFLGFFWEMALNSEAPRKVVEFASSTGDALELFGTALASLLGLILAAKAVKLSEDNERQNSRYQALTSILFDPGYRKWVESKAFFARFGSIGITIENRKELLQMASSEKMNEAFFSPCPHSCSNSHASNISAARSGSQFSLKLLVDFLSTGSGDQNLLQVLAADVRSALLKFEARMDAAWIDRDGDPVVETEVGVADRLANVAFNRVLEASSREPLESVRLDFIPFQSGSRKELVEQLKGSGLNVIATSTTLWGLDKDERVRLIESVEDHASATSPATPAILLLEADKRSGTSIPEWFLSDLLGDVREEDLVARIVKVPKDHWLRALLFGVHSAAYSGRSDEELRSSMREDITNVIIRAFPKVLQMSDDDDFIDRAAKCADEIYAIVMKDDSYDRFLAIGAEETEAKVQAIEIQARCSLNSSRILSDARRAADNLIKRRVLMVFCGGDAA